MNDTINWWNRNLAIYGRPPLTGDQERCAQVLAAIARPYNLHTPASTIDCLNTKHPAQLSILLRCELATYDGGELTRLVIAAHKWSVRVAIRPWAPHETDPRMEAVDRSIREDCEDDADAYEFDPEDFTYLHGINEIFLSTRNDTPGDPFDHHPGLDYLAASAGAVIE